MSREQARDSIMICPLCGGTQVKRAAMTCWDVASQEWQLSQLMDIGYCEVCDEEIIVEEQSLQHPASAGGLSRLH